MAGEVTGYARSDETRATAREIKAHHPNLPVVLATGYADIESIGATSGFGPLSKPYTRQQLAEAIREAIFVSRDNRRGSVR